MSNITKVVRQESRATMHVVITPIEAEAEVAVVDGSLLLGAESSGTES